MDKPPCVKEIVRAYLIKRGCVGLHRYQCACSLDDLIRCQDGEAFGCIPTAPAYYERQQPDRRVKKERVFMWRRMVNRRKPHD